MAKRFAATTDTPTPVRAQTTVKVAQAKGRPMLSWVGKRPLREVRTYPAQLVERFGVESDVSASVDWADWPQKFERDGLLFHGDNKEVLAYLLANGFRGKVDLIYIDPPFDSGADYVRRVQLRGASGTARLEGESYTLGEQIQYTDIWANDNYLQFMFERLLLLKELLAEGGSMYLHCDSARGHQLRCLMDEVFGPEAFLNEIVWSYRRWPSETPAFQSMHDTILLYIKRGTKKHTFNRRYEEASASYMTRFGGKTQRLDEETGTRKITSEEETLGMPLRDVWELSILAGFKAERTGYPTQKPETLTARIVDASSNPGDIVLDAFIGSGTTAAVAQKLGRRWIGCDINKGAIQTTEKRLLEIMRGQAAESDGQQRMIDAAPRPAQLSFSVYRVNDYDLQIQHNEAVNLAAEHLGVQRLRTDSFFDGIRGRELVRIVPFDYPLTPLDLQTIEDELRARPQEERDILVVALGKELAADVWLADYARRSSVNTIRVIELRSDPKYGGFFEHRPASARVVLERLAHGRAKVVISDFLSPTIIERLNRQEGVLAPHIDDWRAMVDSVVVDTAYDGQTFNIAIADIPERKSDLVDGAYEFDLPPESTAIAVRITDMLGEEVLEVIDPGDQADSNYSQ